jgi:hypothetical protein
MPIIGTLLRSEDVGPQDLVGEASLMIRLIASLIAVVVTILADQALAQAAFPAPLPGQAEAPASNASPVPHANGAAPLASLGASAAFPSGNGNDACMNGFMPLREEAEKRGKLIKTASDRKASPDEACKLIGDFGRAELKMIKYVEANSPKCGIPPQIVDQFKNGHKNTEKMQKQVCRMAQRRPSAGPDPDKVLGPGDFWPASAPLLRVINPL